MLDFRRHACLAIHAIPRSHAHHPNCSAHLPPIHLLALGIIASHEEAVHLQIYTQTSHPRLQCTAAQQQQVTSPKLPSWPCLKSCKWRLWCSSTERAQRTWETYWKNSASVRDRSSCTSCTQVNCECATQTAQHAMHEFCSPAACESVCDTCVPSGLTRSWWAPQRTCRACSARSA